MTIYYGRCHWLLALYHVLVRLLIQKKRTLFEKCKKECNML